MVQIRLVDAKDLETLEDYATSLLTGVASLKTLECYHLHAFNKGILEEDEIKLCESIRHDLERLMRLYITQMENILDRTNITQEDILNELRKIMPEIPIPRKRKYQKKKKDAEKKLVKPADL